MRKETDQSQGGFLKKILEDFNLGKPFSEEGGPDSFSWMSNDLRCFSREEFFGGYRDEVVLGDRVVLPTEVCPCPSVLARVSLVCECLCILALPEGRGSIHQFTISWRK